MSFNRFKIIFLTLCCLIKLAVCSEERKNQMKIPSKDKINNPMIIAHRGASGYCPENTSHSFEKAIELKVDAVEFDIYKCKSGDLIVMHDASVDRTTDGKGLICNKTLTELKALNVNGGGKIPTFAEVLDLLDARTKIVIDIKEEGVAGEIAKVINFYIQNKGWQSEQIFATGFQHNELKLLADLCPFIKLIPSVICTPYEGALFTLKMGAYGVCLINVPGCFSETLAKDIKAKGLKLWIWSPSEGAETIKALYNIGADAIMVDYPDVVKEILIEVAKQDKIKQAAFAQRTQSNQRVEIVHKKNARKIQNNQACTAFEYLMEENEINGALIHLDGRYPDEGFAVNLKCKEMTYVISGQGCLFVDGKEFFLSKGSLVLIHPNEKYFWKGKLVLFISSTPAWNIAQHKHILY